MILTFKVSFVEMWNHVRHAGYWIFAVLGMWVLLYFMNAWTWRIIIKGSGDCPVPFWKLYKITITGFALNYATPAGLMGGEPYKIMELLFFFFFTRMAIILPLIALFALSGIYMFVRGYKRGMVMTIIKFLSKLPGCRNWCRRFMEKHAEELKNIDCQIAQLHGQNKHSFYASFCLEYVGRVMQSFEIFFMLRLVNVQGTMPQLFMYSFVILAFTSLFANLLFFMPLQLGGREGGFAMSTVQMKMVGATGMLLTLKEAMTIAVFISIICRLRELVWTCIGMLLMKIGTKVKGNISPVTSQQKSSMVEEQ